jgi:uncharacterized protein (TIGR02246 family)
MSVELPEPMAAYFAAANERDPDRVAACFTQDARVHDEGQDYLGRDSIRAWAEQSGRKYSFTADVRSVERAQEKTVVVAHLTGDFPGSPFDLRYVFGLSEGHISRLEITL